MREEPLSIVEREFILAALREGRRVDGRKLLDPRELTLSVGPAFGVSEVTLGTTRVIACTTAEIVEPLPERPSEGFFFFNVDYNQMSSPIYEDQNIGQNNSIDISRVVEKGIKQARALDVEGLCILSGKKVWSIRVDAHVLDDGGNVIDCTSIATCLSLLHFRRNDVTVTGEEVIIHPFEERNPVHLILHHIPIAVTFGLFKGEAVLMDPTSREELTSDGSSLTIITNTHREICGIHKSGNLPIDQSTILHCTDLAIDRTSQITEKILLTISNK